MQTYTKRRLCIAVERIRNSTMENQSESKVYVHYNHTDPCKQARWTARESYQFMYQRPWQYVNDFYLNLVKGHSSLRGLFGTETNPCEDLVQKSKSLEEGKLENVSTEDGAGRWARVTLKIVLSYHGGSFDGWQKQPDLKTVQGLVERCLGRFVDEKKAKQLTDKSLPVEGCAAVAGRTDKGVTALQQVCSFYTWRRDVKAEEVEDDINNAEPGKLRVISISKVSRVFHPNFSAKWRRYFYIFPFLDEEEHNNEMEKDTENCISDKQYGEHRSNGCLEDTGEENGGCSTFDYEGELEIGEKPRKFSISRVNQLLLQLEGKLLSYKVFARDTKASRSTYSYSLHFWHEIWLTLKFGLRPEPEVKPDLPNPSPVCTVNQPEGLGWA
ncbi:PREDICTED: uncharacterized protein LOC104601650 isoform X2 [Nelumbo nucifera]|uniref:Uncharacterized protein LOC104601650 isoform X2 n=1 Tax=Nelumbo nucifera TaxID=4432 RepID=A0A1U8A9K6_NELNU|nr:PREDICTED: uncharacterized protein LOC104601650 isoform X2 [Nelumbo nucifera]